MFNDDYLTVGQVAACLGKSEGWVRKRVDAGVIEGLRMPPEPPVGKRDTRPIWIPRKYADPKNLLVPVR